MSETLSIGHKLRFAPPPTPSYSSPFDFVALCWPVILKWWPVHVKACWEACWVWKIKSLTTIQLGLFKPIAKGAGGWSHLQKICATYKIISHHFLNTVCSLKKMFIPLLPILPSFSSSSSYSLQAFWFGVELRKQRFCQGTTVMSAIYNGDKEAK